MATELKCPRCNGSGTDPVKGLRVKIWGLIPTTRPDRCLMCHGAGATFSLTHTESSIAEEYLEMIDEGWTPTGAYAYLVRYYERFLTPSFNDYLQGL